MPHTYFVVKLWCVCTVLMAKVSRDRQTEGQTLAYV